MSNNRLKVLLIILLITTSSIAQVGINTTKPTTDFDVNGTVRVRGLSNNNGRPESVSALADGTLVISSSNVDAPGYRFIGFLNSNLKLNKHRQMKNIVLGDELVDTLDEYDTTTGVYAPVSSGYNKVSMDFDIGGYQNTSKEVDILIGLWDNTDDKWVMRRTFHHNALNNDNVSNAGRSQSYGITNYIQLDSTHTYTFRISTTYNSSSATRDAVLRYENKGRTGSSLSTSFSIERIL